MTNPQDKLKFAAQVLAKVQKQQTAQIDELVELVEAIEVARELEQYQRNILTVCVKVRHGLEVASNRLRGQYTPSITIH
jgi:hypothetical protein